MRIDRMLGIIVLLLNRDKISARNLSERFEVSVRTIYRDIESINMAGIPIVSHPGNNGGYGIMENYRLDRQVLSLDDMSSIITALKGVGNSIGDNDLDNIAEKILSLVPHDKVGGLKKRFEEVVIDITPWGFKQKSKDHLKIIQQAISDNTLINFSYRNMRGETLERIVEPMTMIFKSYAWYLFGYCRVRNDFRLFRLSRMDNLKPINEKFVRKNATYKDFFSNDNITAPVNLILKFVPSARIRVEEYFDESSVKFLSDGGIVASILLPEDEWMYSFILGFGETVEVVQPLHVREIIQNRAEKISSIYKHDIRVSQQ
jgi:predicted DNA-binding transcriptional regulator YafY